MSQNPITGKEELAQEVPTTIPGQRILDLSNVKAGSGLPTAALASDAGIVAAMLAAGTVTKAKTALFVSAEQTGTGAPQNIAHGLGVVPVAVFAAPTDTNPVTLGQYTLTEGAHDATNVIVTVTSGKKFKVMAWA